MTAGSATSLAVIVPAWQAAQLLPRSLQALVDAAEGREAVELIVVDPASTDGTGDLAERMGARVLRLERRAGPAHARNVGVEATAAELLLFVDADCVAHPDVIDRAREHFDDPELVSVMGAYDDDPPERNFASLYMNLRHHFVHQHDGRREPASFWSGCGAVRRDAFLRAGGFDAERYPWPSIEDIELGTRLRPLGKTRLDPALNVKHLKRWTVASVVQTDVYSRALPWSKLIVERGELPNDLNLRKHHRVAAAVAPLTLLALLVLPLAFLARAGSLATLCILTLLAALALNRSMIAFFHARGGAWFAVRAWLFHQVHLTYSAATFAIVLARHRLAQRRAPGRSAGVTRVVVLGGGPAGVGAAWRLREQRRADVVLFERNAAVGGNSGSFEWAGHRLDYGSHRLHPACEPEILEHVRAFLGDDLLDRPRHGRIQLLGKWVHFPLKPADLLLHLDKSFTAGTLRDMVAKNLPRAAADGPETFATVLEANLGRTICRHFYFPYARKIWGHEPEELSAIQAHRRVSAGSFLKILRKVLNQVPGMMPPGAGRFFYPRRGFGQISEAYAEAAAALGADLRLGWTVTRVERPRDASAPWRVTAEKDGERAVVEADHLWSSIPLTLLARMLDPAPPAALLEAATRIDYRAMLLVYLELEREQFTEYDAHYFPAEQLAITRLSEPKNYAVRTEPRTTVLCAELPCARGDAHWEASDEELGALVQRDLAAAGLPLDRPPLRVTTRRLPQAYPIYRTGYETAFDPLDAWLTEESRLVSYGRQGLFAHDNTHHALFMAYRAVDCLRDGGFDEAKWRAQREVFATHVVED